jgi:hypothetical protein
VLYFGENYRKLSKQCSNQNCIAKFNKTRQRKGGVLIYQLHSQGVLHFFDLSAPFTGGFAFDLSAPFIGGFALWPLAFILI